MIARCRRVWKTHRDAAGHEDPVLRGVSLSVARGQVLGVIGLPNSGKTTLLHVVSGHLRPDAGEVRVRDSVSIPVGFRGWFARNLSPDESMRFAAALYGADADACVDYVRAFSDLTAREWSRPWSDLDGNRKGAVAFAASLAIPCDLYVVDGNPMVGDAAMRVRCEAALRQRASEAAVLWVARVPRPLKQFATHYAVLAKGRLTPASGREEALERLRMTAA